MPKALQLNQHLSMHKMLGSLGGKEFELWGQQRVCNYLSKKKKKKKPFNTKDTWRYIYQTLETNFFHAGIYIYIYIYIYKEGNYDFIFEVKA